MHYSLGPFIAARLSNWGYQGACVDPWPLRKSKQTNQEPWLAHDIPHPNQREAGSRGGTGQACLSRTSPCSVYVFPALVPHVFCCCCCWSKSHIDDSDIRDSTLKVEVPRVRCRQFFSSVLGEEHLDERGSLDPSPSMFPAPYRFLVLRNMALILLYYGHWVLVR